jgi:hypothetical protein
MGRKRVTKATRTANKSSTKLQALTLAQRGGWIDGGSLADMLKVKSLAKDYNGEGARLEW